MVAGWVNPSGPVMMVAAGPIAALARCVTAADAAAPVGDCIIGIGGGTVTDGGVGAEPPMIVTFHSSGHILSTRAAVES